MRPELTSDPATSRLLTTTTNLQTLTAAADTTNYTYNPAGDITSVSDAQNTGGTQTQCFSYNNLNQLTTAWTDTGSTTTAAAPSVPGIGGCTHTSPAAANIGGPAPYWESYGYDRYRRPRYRRLRRRRPRPRRGAASGIDASSGLPWLTRAPPARGCAAAT